MSRLARCMTYVLNQYGHSLDVHSISDESRALVEVCDGPEDELNALALLLGIKAQGGQSVSRRGLRRSDVEAIARKQADAREVEVGRIAARHFRTLCEGDVEVS